MLLAKAIISSVEDGEKTDRIASEIYSNIVDTAFSDKNVKSQCESVHQQSQEAKKKTRENYKSMSVTRGIAKGAIGQVKPHNQYQNRRLPNVPMKQQRVDDFSMDY